MEQNTTELTYYSILSSTDNGSRDDEEARTRIWFSCGARRTAGREFGIDCSIVLHFPLVYISPVSVKFDVCYHPQDLEIGLLDFAVTRNFSSYELHTSF